MTSFWIFLSTFVAMEGVANGLHRWVMHGFLWCLHDDHHNLTGKAWQKNDFFAFFFAVPSFLSILFGNLQNNINLMAFGLGILAYGIVYFTVHEVIIHRRWRFFRGSGWYFRALIRAHRDHHKVYSKHGASNFGMLIVPWRYYKEEWLAAKKASTHSSVAESS